MVKFTYIPLNFGGLKKLFAITLLAAHLFNISGYYFLYQYFIERSDQQLVQQLDKNQYNDEELVELKLALHLPYITSSEYARIDGEIVIEGTHYNYVKRKVFNDTLYVLCLPNTQKTKLFESRNKFTGQSADLPVSGKEHNTAAKKSQPVNEYNQTLLTYNFGNPAQPAKQGSYRFTPQLAKPFIDHSFQPPEVFHA